MLERSTRDVSTRAHPAQQLCLLGGPYVRQGRIRIDIPEASQRVIAFVALHGRRTDRRHTAGCLWPDGSESRASGNLRSALWRLRGTPVKLLDSDRHALFLRSDAVVDVVQVEEWSRRLIEGEARPEDLRLDNLADAALELLPGWYDEWVLFERERMRQRVLHGLEALAATLRSLGHHASSLEAALTLMNLDPLRESGQRAVIEAHVAEGNVVEARRALDRYTVLLTDELGIAPSPELARLCALPVERDPGGEPRPTPDRPAPRRADSRTGSTASPRAARHGPPRTSPPFSLGPTDGPVAGAAWHEPTPTSSRDSSPR